VHIGETSDCQAMCGVTLRRQRHFYHILRELPRQYVVLQVTASDSSFTLERVHSEPVFTQVKTKELTKNVTEVESQYVTCMNYKPELHMLTKTCVHFIVPPEHGSFIA
jgi:hypothetical protein